MYIAQLSRSRLRCVTLCIQEPACNALNYLQDVTPSLITCGLMKMQLLYDSSELVVPKYGVRFMIIDMVQDNHI